MKIIMNDISLTSLSEEIILPVEETILDDVYHGLKLIHSLTIDSYMMDIDFDVFRDFPISSYYTRMKNGLLFLMRGQRG